MAGLGQLAGVLGDRITTNVSTSFGSLTIQQWIRLIMVAGAYMLLRPYLIKLGGRMQMRQHEADAKASEEEAAAIVAAQANKAALSPNDLRGGPARKQKIALPDDSDSEDGGDGQEPISAAASATDWGKNARRRQRKMIRQLLEAHEEKLAAEQEDEEDKDIQEFLVD